MSGDHAEITLHFSGSTASFRARGYVRGLGRPRILGLLALVGLLPLAVDVAVRVAMSESGISWGLLLVGIAGVLVVVTIGLIVTTLRQTPPSIVVFHDRGIREIVGGRTTEHPWSWIEHVDADRDALRMHCAAPMRSFRLSSGASRILTVPRTTPECAPLEALLATRGHRVGAAQEPTRPEEGPRT